MCVDGARSTPWILTFFLSLFILRDGAILVEVVGICLVMATAQAECIASPEMDAPLRCGVRGILMGIHEAHGLYLCGSVPDVWTLRGTWDV